MNRTQLTFKILKATPKDLPPREFHDAIKYLCDTPDSILRDNEVLRKRIALVVGKQWKDVIPDQHKESIRDLLVRISIVDAQNDFYTFVKLISETVIPNTFRDGRHIQVICEQLQQLYDSYVLYEEDPSNKADRLQVFLPPRSMKSVLCSILFPAWVLGRNPKYRVLLVGNNTQNAIDNFGRPLRNLLLSDEYKDIFPDTEIDNQASAAQRFLTTKNGGFFCAGAGTAIAGKGGDFIICDDVLSEQTAFSKVERTKVNMNYIPGIRSRAQPGAGELIINTRWHLDDLSGFLLKVDGDLRKGDDAYSHSNRPWKVISIPAILDEDASRVLRKPTDAPGAFAVGDSYWPEYKPIDDLLELQKNYKQTEPYKWNALYMQNPVPEEGGIVKYSDWQRWDKSESPKVSQVVVCMDTAYAETDRADYSAYTVWGVFYTTVNTVGGQQEIPHMILLHAEKGKWDFYELCEKCERLRADPKWRPDYFVVEKKASGHSLLQELYRRQFPLVEYDPRGKKEERLQAAAVIMRMGRVWVPEGKEWAEQVVEEVCNFPSSPNDDLTDTVSMAVTYMRDLGVIRHEGYDYKDDYYDEDDGYYKEKSNGSYWNALLGRR